MLFSYNRQQIQDEWREITNMSWLTSVGLLFGIAGSFLITVPHMPWPKIQKIVYKRSPLVQKYEIISSTFTYIRSVHISMPFTIFDNRENSDLPINMSEEAAQTLYGVLRHGSFHSGYDVEDTLESVVIEDGSIRFIFENEANYGMPVDNAFNRLRRAQDGFLRQYYTGKGAYFLIASFLLQFLDALPLSTIL